MVKEKRDVRPVLLKLGVAVVLSVGGILYTFLTTRRIKPSSDSGNQADSSEDRNVDHVFRTTANSCNSTSVGLMKHEASTLKGSVENFANGRSIGDKDGYLLAEFNELVDDFNPAATNAGSPPRQDMETLDNGEATGGYRSVQRESDEREIKSLRNMVKTLSERERELEIQLLEYYGLKEQETAVIELQNRLKINSTEAKLFRLKIASLQADKRKLEAQVADHAKVSAELEAAKAKIKLLKQKLRSEHEQNKEQILALQERVMRLREQENKSATAYPGIQVTLQKLKDLEMEGDELRKSNSNLKQENSELALKLEQVQLLATSMLEDEAITAAKEESQRLRQENEDLVKEMERIQEDHCTDLEELVYLRWVNACLRYELRNVQPGPGKTIARDLSKTLSPKSEKKAKQLLFEYATKEGLDKKFPSSIDFDSDQWLSSQASCLTDSGEVDDSSMDISSTSKTHTPSKRRVFYKLLGLLRGRDSYPHSHSPSTEIASILSDAGADQMNERLRRSSRGSKHSLELERRSDAGGFHVFRSFDLIAEDATGSTQVNWLKQDAENFEKSELARYAEVLKDSRKTSDRRRSAFRSF